MNSTDRALPTLDRMPVTQLKGVGPVQAEKLFRLGISTVWDVLLHLPGSYEDRTRIIPLQELQPGMRAVFVGTLEDVRITRTHRHTLECKLREQSSSITLRFFHFSTSQYRLLARGGRLRCYGEIRKGRKGLEVFHPEYTFVSPHDSAPQPNSLTAVYPATEGITQYLLRSISAQALKLANPTTLPDLIEDFQPPDDTLSLLEALKNLHAPPADSELLSANQLREESRRRLAFEELLANLLGLLRIRDQSDTTPAPSLTPAGSLKNDFLEEFGYPLTAAQRKVSATIEKDLTASAPMQRLLQGDVGSGKTVIAALAALQAVVSGYQTAIMAPTEILAEQHYLSLSQWLLPLGITIGWLTSRVKGRTRTGVLNQLESGTIKIIAGTHALLQDDVQFRKLGLTVVDEQHRFGVAQRHILREKGITRSGLTPHQLIMTATPIPRTLAMIAYSDLKQSILDELPPGRQPVDTVLISEQRRTDVIERVRAVCREGRQAYWICTLVEESEILQCQSAEATAAQLSKHCPDLRIGLIHGRFKAAEKTSIMAAFRNHELDLLVATTVVEVGVDVPNATLMVIENSERLGLAQLHQLRGRIGRGRQKSFCVLLHADSLSPQARQRLATLREHSDGFEIADKDLEMRGPGELLGTKQAGLMNFRIADLKRDRDLIEPLRKFCIDIRNNKPKLIKLLSRRWLSNSERFVKV